MKKREMFGKIGLVLGGGGGKGLFQVGAIAEIVKNNIPFCYVAGVSAGGVVAAKCLEVMPDAEEMEKAALIKFRTPPFLTNRELFRHPLKTKSLLDNAPLKRLIAELDMNKIMNSPVEFHVITSNLLTGKEKVFSNRCGDPELFRKAIIASTAIPGVFRPEIINGAILIDGTVINPLPVKNAIAAGCDTIIVVETDPKENLISPEIFAEMGWLEILFRGYGFPVKQLIEKELIRTSRINQNLIGLKLIQRKITKAAGKKQKEIEAVFNENHFYFESRKKIRLVIIQPDKPLLTSGLKWTPNDAVQMIAEGKKIAEAELKKAGLI